MTALTIILAIAAIVAFIELRSIAASLRTTNEVLSALVQRPPAAQVEQSAPSTRRRVIAINVHSPDNYTAHADDGTNWAWDDEHGWLLARFKHSIPQQETSSPIS
ncbi:MAG: hypothetical protein ACRD88_03335 [Terriglobia bacterium]